jgi:hypothetical protein
MERLGDEEEGQSMSQRSRPKLTARDCLGSAQLLEYFVCVWGADLAARLEVSLTYSRIFWHVHCVPGGARFPCTSVGVEFKAESF